MISGLKGHMFWPAISAWSQDYKLSIFMSFLPFPFFSFLITPLPEWSMAAYERILKQRPSCAAAVSPPHVGATLEKKSCHKVWRFVHTFEAVTVPRRFFLIFFFSAAVSWPIYSQVCGNQFHLKFTKAAVLKVIRCFLQTLSGQAAFSHNQVSPPPRTVTVSFYLTGQPQAVRFPGPDCWIVLK